MPAEAIVEAEPDGWWTIGRRLRVGAAVAERAELDLAAVDDAYLLTDPPPPYHRLTGHLDGLAVWRAPDLLGLDPSVFAGLGIPPARPLLWDPAELVYQAEFPLAGGGALRVPRHRGGRMDWFSADATLPLGAAEPPASRRHATPTPVRCTTRAHRPTAGGRSRTRPWTSAATRRTAPTSPPRC